MNDFTIITTGDKYSLPYFPFLQELEKYFQIIDPPLSSLDSVDLILAFGHSGLVVASSLKDDVNAPILFVTSTGNIDISHILKLSSFNEIIIINESFRKSSLEFTNHEFSTVLYPLINEIGNNSHAISLNKNNLIFYIKKYDYVCFFQLLEVINTLPLSLGGEVSVIFDSKVESYLNENIKLYPSTEIDSLLPHCDIFIGNGESAKKSIIHGKPTIVVGAYGYGGIVNDDSINFLSKYNFEGRPGGYFDEPIPVNLVIDDIITISRTSAIKLKPKLRSNKEFLILQKENTVNLFFKIIKRVIKSFNEVINVDTKFVISSLYKIMRNGNEYFLINTKTNQIHAVLGEEEYEVIDFFRNETTAKSYLQDTRKKLSENELLEFISELKMEKILYSDRV